MASDRMGLRQLACRFTATLMAVMGLVALQAPEAWACGPYVTGRVSAGGVPVPGESVDILKAGDGINPPQSFDAVTDEDGEFMVCVYGTGTVSITIAGETRTRSVNGFTDFGTWEVRTDRDYDGIDDAEEDELLARYAPQLRLQHAEWNFPASAPWILARTTMRYTHPNCSDHQILPFGAVTNDNVTEQRHQNTSGWPWCDHEGGFNRSDTYSPDDVKKGFFLQQDDSTHGGAVGDRRSWVAYGHAYPSNLDGIVLQYWFFYAYNDSWASFNHEGDWEYVAVLLNPDGSVSNLTYFQHNNSKVYYPNEITWVNGTHPVAYVAKGAHSNYARRNLDDCEGGPTYDDCDDGGPWWNTWDAASFGGVVNVGERFRPLNGQNWLRYSGRFGEIGATDILRFTSGPKGPAYQWTVWRIWGGYEKCANGNDDDVDGAIDEADCIPTPDLTLSEVNPAAGPDGPAGPAVVLAGESLPVRVQVDNTGGGANGVFSFDLGLSVDPLRDASDIQMPGDFDILGMFGHSSLGPLPTWTAQVPFSVAPGSYWLTSRIDVDDTIDEGSTGESNNDQVSDALVRVVASPLALENFNDGVAGGLTPHHGSWSVVNGSYRASGTGLDDNDTVSLMSVPVSAHALEFDASVVTASGAYNPYFGGILRFTDAANFLRLDTYRSSATTYVRLLGWKGTHTTLAVATLPADLLTGIHHFKIIDTGCRVTAQVDGVDLFTTSYVLDVPKGTVGLFANTGTTVRFDNLLVTGVDDDLDDDGVTACGGDCNDANPNIRPGRPEVCSTTYDDDCDGAINEGCSGSGGGGGSPMIRKESSGP